MTRKHTRRHSRKWHLRRTRRHRGGEGGASGYQLANVGDLNQQLKALNISGGISGQGNMVEPINNKSIGYPIPSKSITGGRRRKRHTSKRGGSVIGTLIPSLLLTGALFKYGKSHSKKKKIRHTKRRR